MKFLDFFKTQPPRPTESFDLTEIIQQMFDAAGITPQRLDGVFRTIIDGVHCSFQTILLGDKHTLTVFAPFQIPVPAHVAHAVRYEVERLNAISPTANIIFQEDENGGYKLNAITNKEFTVKPTTDEIKMLMLHNIDIIDNANFRSLASAIFGFASYEEVEKMMLTHATRGEGNNLSIKMTDGYTPLCEKSDITSPRYGGRLLMFATHILEEKKSKEYANELLTKQTPFDELVQEAYNLADDTERDVIRKLRYLMVAKQTPNDNDSDSLLGRIEAMGIIEKDNYALLQ